MDAMAKTGERQRRSRVSKWNFGGGLRHRAACGLGARRGVVAVAVVVAVVVVSVVTEGNRVVVLADGCTRYQVQYSSTLRVQYSTRIISARFISARRPAKHPLVMLLTA